MAPRASRLRIERARHDGAQNRLVAVTVLLGIVRQALARDPSTAFESLDRAQGAAEAALADLRSVVWTVLPPVLSDRGLSGAIDGLAAASSIPCRIQVEVATRCAAAVEATAYFTVAEALTNAVRHSGASRILAATTMNAMAAIGWACQLRAPAEREGAGFSKSDMTLLVSCRVPRRRLLPRSRSRLVTATTLSIHLQRPDGIAHDHPADGACCASCLRGGADGE